MGNRFKILVIDDEIQLLEVVKAYLIKEGYDVYTSYNGEEGLRLFEIIKPPFLILDLMLPDLSGEEICKKIRETSTIPIIISSARGELSDKILGFDFGADDYLAKPYEPRELVIRINAMLRRSVSSAKTIGDFEID